ncbi:MAG: type II toxin-antitoxin system VapC family toxin [Pyrinomonadaceae bacterium]
MTTRRNIVFDSWPVMAYLQGEPPVKRIIEIIADAHERGDSLLMSVINAGEVWYSIASRSNPDTADGAIELVQSLGIEFIEVDWPTTQIAARYKARGGISYADCFSAALTKISSSPPARGGVAPASGDEVVGAGRGGGSVLLTGDREFKQLEKEIDIVWL